MPIYFIFKYDSKIKKAKMPNRKSSIPTQVSTFISAKEKPKANYSLKNQQFVKKVEQTVKQKTEEKNAATESTL
jgi:hypothetical protein